MRKKTNTHGPRPSGTKVIEDNPKRKVVEHTLK
jgi:hypothetical protein